MKIRRFFGKDMRDALSQVKEELGSEAVIMSNRKVADGIELVAAYDKEPEAKLSPNTPARAKGQGIVDKPLPSLSEIIGDDGPDSLRALLEKQAEQKTKVAQRVAQHNETVQRTQKEPEQSNVETSFEKSNAQVSEQGNVGELADIRAEIASLRSVLQFQFTDIAEQKQSRLTAQQRYLLEQLCEMGIEKRLATELVSYTPSDVNEREAWLYLLKLLANRVPIGNDDILSQRGVVALVGPTGTGKTTTVAKLAAKYAQKYGSEHIALITIDTYRIAAYEQLATYGKIIGCPVRKAQSSEQLADLLFQYRNKRLVLIDTAGFSQRDSRLITQLAAFQHAGGQPIKNYLVLQGNTQQATIKHIIDAYDTIDLQGTIITKLDECYSLGEVLSNVIEARLPVCYITDGQQVPDDIHVANAKSIISLAAKLYKKYSLTHTSSNVEVNTA